MELEKHRIDICCISETKRKGKGNFKYQSYIMMHSGVNKDQRAHAGVGILVSDRLAKNIENVEYLDERLLHVTMNFDTDRIHIVSCYAPDISKTRPEREAFFNDLQDLIKSIPLTQKIFVIGDLNAKIGNQAISGVMQKYNKDELNDNGELLITMSTQSELRINNTYFQHKWQHKYTWSNTRRHTSVINRVITNRSIHPKQILDVRALTSADVGSDHRLILCKYRSYNRLIMKKRKPEYVTKYNIESFANDSTKDLYQRRLTDNINNNSIEEVNDVEQAWEKIKNNILKSAGEAISTRRININGKRNSKPWFVEEVKVLAEEKRKVYLRYRSNQTAIELEGYKAIRNRVNNRIKELKRQYWEGFTKSMESDLYGSQKKIWNMLRNRKKHR